MSRKSPKRAPRIAVARLLAGMLALGLAPTSPEPARAIPDPSEFESARGTDRVGLLFSLGLHDEAEAILRREIEAGDSTATPILVQLLVRRGRSAEAVALLDAATGAIPGAESAFGWFTVGRAYQGEDAWAEAAEAFLRSSRQEPLLSDHAAFRAADAYERIDSLATALDLFETAAAAARAGDLAALASWRAAGIAVAKDDPDRALANLERIPARSVVAREDRLELEAQLWRGKGNAEREARVLRELFDRAPTSEQALAAVDRLEALETPTVVDRVTFAETALQNRHGTLAESQARRALAMIEEEVTPDPQLAGRARLALGKALMLRRHLTNARRVLDEMPAGADSTDRAEARLDRARCLWKLGQIDAALAEYDALQDGNEPEEARGTAAWEAAREAKDDRRWREAALRMAEFRRRFPEHEYAADAAWHEGRAWAEIGESERALAAFDALRTEHPDSPFLAEAAYWATDVHLGAGEGEAACAELRRLLTEHPDSYWAARAREGHDEYPCPDAFDEPSGSEDDRDAWLAERFPEIDAEESRQAAIALSGSESFRRAAALAAVGLVGEAETELVGLRRSLGRDAAALVAFAEGAWRIGVPRAGMRAMTVVRARDGLPILSGQTPSRVARLLYPVEHLDSVLRWSAEFGLDPLFVYAVMREESWFDTQAVSWVGARGLLQIMPSTGRDLARRAGLPDFDRADLFDPDVNIHLGTFYLRALLDELEREPALALSAYNAGKRNALRWKKGIDGEFDVDEYVASITYRETSRYVQKVSRTWAIYRHLYGNLVPSLRELGTSEIRSP